MFNLARMCPFEAPIHPVGTLPRSAPPLGKRTPLSVAARFARSWPLDLICGRSGHEGVVGNLGRTKTKTVALPRLAPQT